MGAPKEATWKLEPHGRAKHEILRRYLGAWFPILNTCKDRILYVDGFCGPGRYEGGEPGSPIIALEVAKNHRQALKGELLFWFIDERADRVEHLKRELATLQLPPRFKVHPEIGHFDEKFMPVLAGLEAEGKHLSPTFAFIDPFGFSGIPFSLISRFLRQPSCEAFITFMADAINRWLEHPNPEVGHHIEDVFGTDEVLAIANGTGKRVANLRELYQRQLQTAARFVRYFEMRDERDRIQYYLFHASNNRVGHLKMKEAMWKVSPGGEFRYSDATDPNQLVLLEIDPIPMLKKILIQRFGGQKTTGDQIRLFVEDETAFIGKHKTATMEQLENSKQIQVESTKLNGKKRKGKTYPDDVIVDFLRMNHGRTREIDRRLD